MKLNTISKLAVAIFISQLAGIIGSLFTVSAIPTWYATLAKPSFNPPSWVFGPVWTLLYLLMGIAAFLIWKKGLERKDVRTALALFLGQLVLNSIWSVIFFGLHSPFWALVDIICLFAVIILTSIYFFKVSKASVFLMLPYIAWVGFALYLNYSIWILNL